MSNTEANPEVDITYRVPRMWTVRILNDDFTPMDFVVNILREVFNKTEEDSNVITTQVHETGSGMVGVYTKDIAMTKTTRAMRMCEDAGHPLEILPEPME